MEIRNIRFVQPILCVEFTGTSLFAYLRVFQKIGNIQYRILEYFGNLVVKII